MTTEKISFLFRLSSLKNRRIAPQQVGQLRPRSAVHP